MKNPLLIPIALVLILVFGFAILGFQWTQSATEEIRFLTAKVEKLEKETKGGLNQCFEMNRLTQELIDLQTEVSRELIFLSHPDLKKRLPSKLRYAKR